MLQLLYIYHTEASLEQGTKLYAAFEPTVKMLNESLKYQLIPDDWPIDIPAWEE